MLPLAMKKILFLFTLLITSLIGNTQNPAFTFSVLSATKTEGSGNTLLAYVKANNPVTSTTAVDVVLKSGFQDSVQINNFTFQTLTFNPSIDSLAFSILLTDDTLVNPNQKVTFVLQNPTAASTIGTDSIFTLTINDNDLPATITFQTDTASRFEHELSYSVCVDVNNPNPFAIRYYMRSYDCGDNIPGLNACGGYDYFFDWGWHFAPPGISTFCENIRMVDDLVNEANEKLKIILTDSAQGNIFTDSVLIFTIKNDDYFSPPTISFDFAVDSNWEDSARTVAVPITITNPNYNVVEYNIAPNFVTSTATTGLDFVLPNTLFSHGTGTFHDTARLKIIHDFKVESTESVVLRILYKNINTSADTNYTFYIKDRDSVAIGFIGAGYTHVESEGVCLVPIVSTSSIDYPISVDIKYLNGNATKNVDFIFNDTTVVFPANSSDTQYVKVVLLQDNLDEGNEQINLSLSNINPSFTRTSVIQYTFTIIDDDTAFTSIKNIAGNEEIQIYPNPVQTKLYIKAERNFEQLVITSILGEKLYIENVLLAGKHTIELGNIPAGIYLVTLTKDGESISRKFIKE